MASIDNTPNSVELYDFTIGETSGVTDPANELPGWAVLKAAHQNEDLDEILEEIRAFEKSAASLCDALQSQHTVVSDAPQSVQDAFSSLVGYLQEAMSDAEDATTSNDPNDNDASTTPPGNSWPTEKTAVPFQNHPLAPADTAWDAGEAVKRLRKELGCEDAPNQAFAKCFLYMAAGHDRNGDGVADDFNKYKLPICDVIDGQVMVVPAALDQVDAVMKGRNGGALLPASDRAAVNSVVAKYRNKMEVESSTPVVKSRSASWLRRLLSRGGEIEMEKAEFEELFAASSKELAKSLTEAVTAEFAKATAGVGVGSDSGTKTYDAGEDTPSQTNAIQKAVEAEIAKTLDSDAFSAVIEKTLEPIKEALVKAFDRLEALEGNTAVSKSIRGQDGDDAAGDKPLIKSNSKEGLGAIFTHLVKSPAGTAVTIN